MIVTIDGPSGVGKSTVAQALAARLGFECLNTGSMYRAVALAMQRLGIDCRDADAVAVALSGMKVEIPRGLVLLDGENVGPLLRTPEVTRGASEVSVHRCVRLKLVGVQRAAAVGRSLVCDGRDQGSFVFPTAAAKFFLTAHPRTRAERRAKELADKGQPVTAEEVMRDQEERDRRDAARDLAPMVPAPDALRIDTTHLTTLDVIERLERAVLSLRACPRRPNARLR
ncbi:MAG: (d)CMP kinase [Gemmataceae bacterium]|nr:(d)CMP kinase [Gemmataceae bacterium]